MALNFPEPIPDYSLWLFRSVEVQVYDHYHIFIPLEDIDMFSVVWFVSNDNGTKYTEDIDQGYVRFDSPKDWQGLSFINRQSVINCNTAISEDKDAMYRILASTPILKMARCPDNIARRVILGCQNAPRMLDFYKDHLPSIF